ncbi:hypothetical protein P8452_69720 [Trifolium repens]|nr:hypothetical protein P8452_69720 [Trifolium repens]
MWWSFTIPLLYLVMHIKSEYLLRSGYFFVIAAQEPIIIIILLFRAKQPGFRMSFGGCLVEGRNLFLNSLWITIGTRTPYGQ